MQNYLENCRNNVIDWYDEAVLQYPESIKISLNKTEIYGAAIGITGSPPDPGEAVPSGTPTQTGISIQCFVTAELLAPSDGSLRVDEIGNTDRSFAPDGKVDWSWPVTALQSGHHDLRLVLRAAVQNGPDNLRGDPTTQTVTRITDVDVDSTFMQDVQYWWETNWKTIVAILGAIGGGILAFIVWAGSLAEALAKLKATLKPSFARGDKPVVRSSEHGQEKPGKSSKKGKTAASVAVSSKPTAKRQQLNKKEKDKKGKKRKYDANGDLI
jgi:hypothetical protein